MKSSMFLTATGAIMALATPLDKRVMETDVVVAYQTVTVTAGDVEAAAATTTSVEQATFVNGGKHLWTMTSSTAEEVTSTQAPQVVYVTSTQTYGAASVEETTPAPVVVYTTEDAQTTEAAPTTEAASTTEEAVATTTQAASSYVEVPAASSTVAAAAPSDMASTAIDAHNLHRANHSAGALEWLDEIATYAETTANSCVFAHDMDQGSGNYGQNIAMWASSSDAAALGEAGAIGMATHDMWYNGEVDLFLPSYYGESTPDMSNFEAWGHFSQLVWKDSNQLGCYAKLCKAGTMYSDMDAWYMVCNYRPAGNVGGSYGTNIDKSLGEATVTN